MTETTTTTTLPVAFTQCLDYSDVVVASENIGQTVKSEPFLALAARDGHLHLLARFPNGIREYKKVNVQV